MLLLQMIAPSSITSLHAKDHFEKRGRRRQGESCIGDDMYHSRTITILLMLTIWLESAGVIKLH